MQLELKPHPSQADHPTKPRQKLIKDGKPVPLFPDERSVWLDGDMIGYIGPAPGRSFNSLIQRSKLPDVIVEEVVKLVVAEFGTVPAASNFAVEETGEETTDWDDLELQEFE